MRKKMNLGLLIMATGLILMAVAFIITACGPAEEPTPKPVAPGDDGSITGGKGNTIEQPADPTDRYDPITKKKKPLDELAEPGLFKNFTKYEFDGWYIKDTNDKFTQWDTELTEAVVIEPKFKALQNLLPEGDGDSVTKTFKFFDTATFTSTDKFTLMLNQNITISDQIVLKKANTDLTIKSIGSKTITSGLTGNKTTISGTGTSATSDHKGVLILLGEKDITGIKLTLANVSLKGSTGVNDSLIRVQYSAELILEDQSGVKGHNNSATLSSGREGNGSAVCVANKGILTVKHGAVIEENKATGKNDNQLLVGGVYAIDEAVINMTGGFIKDNVCTDTKDVYATEDVVFNLSGDMNIGEITINSENSKNTTINISGLSKEIEKLNLRASDSTTLKAVQDAWVGKTILAAPTGSTTFANDVPNIKLGEFRGTKPTTGTNPVAPKDDIKKTHKIDTSGKLVAN